MRIPSVKRQPAPRSGCCQFFRCGSGRAPFVPGNVLCLAFYLLVRQRDGTTHLWRVDHHRDGGYRECWDGSLSPSNISVPSSHPTQKTGGTSLCTSEAQVRVRGSTH